VPSSGATRSYRSPGTYATYTSSYNLAKLKSLIIGATVQIRLSDGVGSGVITTIKGRKYILTANHVIKGTYLARVISLKDGSSGLVNRTGGWHEGHDIAAIPLPRAMQHLPAVPLYRGQLPVGQPVYLSGFPGGSYNVTAGVVTGYSPTGSKMLHSAHGEPGSSGGMLITPNGYLCGIHTASFLPGSVLYPNKLATPSTVVIGLVNVYGR
jgi:S1-C subfamily serine protease